MNIALSGLRAAQLQLDVTSNNISNANVEGYTRKSLPTSSVVGANSGTVFGVTTGLLQRDMDTALRRDYWTQLNRESLLSTRTEYLNKIQSFHGASDSQDSLSNAVNNLEASYVRLAASPDDSYLQQQVVNQAVLMANQFNDFGDLIVNTRNDIQAEIQSSVDRVNNLLDNIAVLNNAIKTSDIAGTPIADLEDQRDTAIAELNKLVKVSTFSRSDGVIVVQVGQGTVVSEEEAQRIFFSNTTIGTTNVPNSIYVNDINGLDLSTIEIGGQLGALLELRDKTLPSYQAQMDELAHKMALRFESQGMELFTDIDGSIPGNNVTDYLGFASRIRVNQAVLDDPTLVRDGTEPGLAAGVASSQFIQKILDFTFGATEGVNAEGTADMLAAGDVWSALGISATARVPGTENIESIGVLTSHDDIGTGDTFTLRLGTGVVQSISIGAADTAQDLVDTINTTFGGTLTASLGGSGQIAIEGSDDVTIGLGSLSADGLSALGLSVGVTTAVDPSFSVELSTGSPTTITIEETDTAADLVNKLNAITGVSASLGAGNILQIEPEFGGELSLLNVEGTPLDAIGISFDVMSHTAMNTSSLGADGTIASRIESTDFIGDYARRMINIQSSDYNDAVTTEELEGDYRLLLEKSIKDRFGVDVDQEVAQIIQIQANYSAAAQVVTAAQELFDELLATFR